MTRLVLERFNYLESVNSNEKEQRRFQSPKQASTEPAGASHLPNLEKTLETLEVTKRHLSD